MPLQAGNCRDLDFGVLLPVPGAAAIVLAAAELLDVELFPLEQRLLNLGGDAGAGDRRLADLHGPIARQAQHLVERDRVAIVDPIAEVDLHDLPFLDLILTTVRIDNRVHQSSLLALKAPSNSSHHRTLSQMTNGLVVLRRGNYTVYRTHAISSRARFQVSGLLLIDTFGQAEPHLRATHPRSSAVLAATPLVTC